MPGTQKVKRDNHPYRFSSEWIHQLESEEHWRLYWRQQKLMEDHLQSGDQLLEVGPGSGFTADYLRARGFELTTVDIDKKKEPDIVANVAAFVPDRAFDHILAFQVFEHVPFPDFTLAVENLSQKCRKCFFISLPHYKRVAASLTWRLPKLGRHRFTLTMPKRRLEAHHHWEIGYGDIDESTVVDTFHQNGLVLDCTDEAFCRSFFVFRKT